MRSRKDIDRDIQNVHISPDTLIIEVLLDLRDLLKQGIPKRKYTRRKGGAE